jgi:hypothetical protein
MRKSLLTLVPLLFLVSCDQGPVAPSSQPFAPTLRGLSTGARTDIERGSVPVVGASYGTCTGGFDVLADWTAEFRHSMRYDRDGNLVQDLWVYRYSDGSVYNSRWP